VVVGDARAQAPAPAADKVLPLPADVVDGRSVVQRRMSKHGASLMELTLAVTLLQRKTVAEAATRIGSDTGLPVMPPGPTETPSQRSFRFLEGVLRERTATLAKASGNGDNAALATAFGNMMQACISCHSLYLHQPDQAAPKP
jgi:Cytochrome C'